MRKLNPTACQKYHPPRPSEINFRDIGMVQPAQINKYAISHQQNER